MRVILLHPTVHPDEIGLIPGMLAEDDPRPAREQFDERYAHGGGWRPMKGFEVRDNLRLKYPGDPPMDPIAMLKLRDELIVIYRHGFVAIYTKGVAGFEVARMD